VVLLAVFRQSLVEFYRDRDTHFLGHCSVPYQTMAILDLYR
jgi:hypothetical protein